MFRSRLRCRAFAVVPMSSASFFSVILSCPVSSDRSCAAAMADLDMPRRAAEGGLSGLLDEQLGGGEQGVTSPFRRYLSTGECLAQAVGNEFKRG